MVGGVSVFFEPCLEYAHDGVVASDAVSSGGACSGVLCVRVEDV